MWSRALCGERNVDQGMLPLPYEELRDAYSYRNAQRFRQTGQYPLRCAESRALFGCTSTFENIVPFYSEYCANSVMGERNVETGGRLQTLAHGKVLGMRHNDVRGGDCRAGEGRHK